MAAAVSAVCEQAGKNRGRSVLLGVCSHKFRLREEKFASPCYGFSY